MKITLSKSTNTLLEEFYWVRSDDGSITKCFVNEDEALKFYHSIKISNPKEEIIMEKEVSDANHD